MKDPSENYTWEQLLTQLLELTAKHIVNPHNIQRW
jgi:hypothetical protein